MCECTLSDLGGYFSCSKLRVLNVVELYRLVALT